MKPLRFLLLGFSLIGFATGATPSPSFSVARPQFETGDSIIIDQVESTKTASGQIEQVTVRGHYALHSHAKAKLGLYVTTNGPSAPTPVDPNQTMEIAAGAGTFELKHQHGSGGALHVSFYNLPYGSSFGGVYFAPK